MGIRAVGCQGEELIPMPDGKRNAPPDSAHGGTGAHRGVSPRCELKENASSPGFHVKCKLFGSRALSL